MKSVNLDFLDRWLWPAAEARFTGYQVAVGSVHGAELEVQGGRRSADLDAQQVDADSRFDLASLTKLYTATLAAILHDACEIDLAAPVGEWLSGAEFASGVAGFDLLTHSSGLPPEWLERETRTQTIESLLETQLSTAPGELIYSCTGYGIITVALEQKFGISFEKLLKQRLLAPLGLTQTGFNPAGITENVVASARDDRGLPVVHDPRARAMAGVSGNAGLFANASDVFRFLGAVYDSTFISAGARELLFSPRVRGEWSQGVGFRRHDVVRLGSAANCYSHTGFTGTLALIEPDEGKAAVLLTNRVVVDASRENITETYRQFAEWAMAI